MRRPGMAARFSAQTLVGILLGKGFIFLHPGGSWGSSQSPGTSTTIRRPRISGGGKPGWDEKAFKEIPNFLKSGMPSAATENPLSGGLAGKTWAGNVKGVRESNRVTGGDVEGCPSTPGIVFSPDAELGRRGEGDGNLGEG